MAGAFLKAGWSVEDSDEETIPIGQPQVCFGR
jgi:hypothetical protein